MILPSKGGVERSVRIAKDHLCPKDSNLLSAYDSFSDLENAARNFDQFVNQRTHGSTGKIPALELDMERNGFHRLPKTPYTNAFGVMRKVDPKMPIVRFQNVSY